MKCADYTKKIYLWNELEQHEKAGVLSHLENCADCKKLFDETQALFQITNKVAQHQPEIPHAAQLTSKIMEGVYATRKKPSGIKIWWSQHGLRLTSLSFSLVLLFAFGIEYFNVGAPAQTRNQSTSGTVILNARMFKEKALQATTNNHKECNSEFLSGDSYLQCVRKNFKSLKN